MILLLGAVPVSLTATDSSMSSPSVVVVFGIVPIERHQVP